MDTVLADIDAVQACTELQSCASIAECAALFEAIVAKVGFDVFAFGEIDLDNRRRNALIHAQWPKEWLAFYAKSGFAERDPILNALSVSRQSFSWSEIIANPKLAAADREVILMATEQGWRQGLAIAVPRGGSLFGLVSLVGRSADLAPGDRSKLRLMGECLLTRVRALGHPRPFAIPPAGLSPREMEALQLVATGYADAEIGRMLGISRETAHKHVEAARKKLGAKTRAHMSALGVALGIVGTD